MEEFKLIDGTNYSISTLGRIKNNITSRILKPWNKGKYLAVWLGANNPFYIHKLMGTIFLNPIEGYDIDHVNRNKHDNALTNLRYVSKSENSINTPARNILKEKNITKVKDSYSVRIYRNGQYAFIKNFKTLQEAITARNIFINSK